MPLSPEDLEILFGTGTYGEEAGLLNDRAALAQQLRNTPAPGMRQVGRVAVAANPLEMLAAGLQQYQGHKQLGGIMDERKALIERLRKGNMLGAQQAMGNPMDPAVGAQLMATGSRNLAPLGAQLLQNIRGRGQAKPGDQPAPPEWGALPGMTKGQAITSGYAKKPEGEGVLPQDVAGEAKKWNILTTGRKVEQIVDDINRARQAAGDRKATDDKERTARTEATNKTRMDLRKEFNALPVVKKTQEVAEANAKIQGTSPTGPGDISLLVAYMKMIDPGSTVRENEFATAENAGGVSAKVRNVYNRLIEGDKLPEEMRGQFRTEAQKILEAQLQNYEATATHYQRFAEISGIDPADVVMDLGYRKQGKRRKYNPATGTLE